MKYHTLLAIVILAISTSSVFSKSGEQGGMKDRCKLEELMKLQHKREEILAQWKKCLMGKPYVI
ncbi:MAG: hypothetical protein HC877_10085 [Thioploca sp.]|nr:hypothetical protein [Thioploca sp.]